MASRHISSYERYCNVLPGERRVIRRSLLIAHLAALFGHRVMFPFPRHRGPPACVIGLFYFMYRLVMRLPREMNDLSFHQHPPQMKNAEANHRFHKFMVRNGSITLINGEVSRG
jgi:hypothetical protein